MIQGISGALSAATSVQGAKGKNADGDNDGTKAAKASAPKIGPAVTLSLSNVAKNDMANGDPDHDGH